MRLNIKLSVDAHRRGGFAGKQLGFEEGSSTISMCKRPVANVEYRYYQEVLLAFITLWVRLDANLTTEI